MIVGLEKAGVDHEALLDTYIRAINVITQERPHDLTIGVHMCRGNFKVILSHFNTNLEFLLKYKPGHSFHRRGLRSNRSKSF